jgi:hypothetical protein
VSHNSATPILNALSGVPERGKIAIAELSGVPDWLFLVFVGHSGMPDGRKKVIFTLSGFLNERL